MSFHPDNMDNVADFGELLPEDWYHVRVKKVVEQPSKESGELCAYLTLSVQEEPFIGRAIPVTCSLQAHALGSLKAFYKATGKGYTPGQSGHDPELLVDGECYVKVTHGTSKNSGEKRMQVPAWGIKSIMEGKPA